MSMDYYRALEVADSDDAQLRIDEVLEALKCLAHAARAYRALYENAIKKMEMYRDVSAKPDIFRKPWENDNEQHGD